MEDEPDAVREWALSAAFPEVLRSAAVATLALYVGIVGLGAAEASGHQAEFRGTAPPRCLPVPNQHHVGRGRASPRQLRHQHDLRRLGGHPRLGDGRPGRRQEPETPPSRARAAPRGSRAPGSRRRAGVRRPQRQSPFANRTSRAAPSGFVFPGRTITSTASPAAASATSSGGRSPRCAAIPAMKRRPTITASSRTRLRATSSDSTPRPRCRGRWQVARTAAESGGIEGRA